MSNTIFTCYNCNSGFDNVNPPYTPLHKGTFCPANFHERCITQEECPTCSKPISSLQKNFFVLKRINDHAAKKTYCQNTTKPTQPSLAKRVALNILAPPKIELSQKAPEPNNKPANNLLNSVSKAIIKKNDNKPIKEDFVLTDQDYLCRLYVSSKKFRSMDPQSLAKDLENSLDELSNVSFSVIHEHMSHILEKNNITQSKEIEKYVKQTKKLNPEQQKLICKKYIEYLTN